MNWENDILDSLPKVPSEAHIRADIQTSLPPGVEAMIAEADAKLVSAPWPERRGWARRLRDRVVTWLRIQLELHRDVADFVERDQLAHRRMNDLLRKHEELKGKFTTLEKAHLDLVGDFNTWIGHLTPYEQSVLAKKLRARRRGVEGANKAADAIVKAEAGAAAAGRPLAQAEDPQ